MTDKIYIEAPVGAATVADASLMMADLLHVEREGIGYTQIGLLTSFVNREFKHNSAHGLIIFDPNQPFNPGEIIYVMFKR